jgi:two-component system, chemotaxis family, chemotaxis protein CheY
MTQNPPRIFDLPPTLHDADSALALVAELRKLPVTDEIHLNAAVVTSISPVYLQILVSSFKTLPRLSVLEASAAFSDAFAGYCLAYPQALPQIDDDVPVAPAERPPGMESEPAPDQPLPAMAVPEHAEAAEAGPVNPPSPTADSSAVSGGGNQTDGADMPNAAAPRTILTIDDSRTMRDMLKMALGGAGFTVLQAVDGQDGLNVLAKQPVDVIITDINMPKLDGYGVIRAVRSDPAYNATPILVLSTEAEQESKDIAKDAGATGWIVKPFDPDGLVQLVNAVCA